MISSWNIRQKVSNISEKLIKVYTAASFIFVMMIYSDFISNNSSIYPTALQFPPHLVHQVYRKVSIDFVFYDIFEFYFESNVG